MRCIVLGVALTVLSWPDALPGQTFSPNEARTIDSVAKAEMAAWRAPGMILIVLRGGRLAYRAAYGTGNVETRVPMTADLMVSVASVSKMVTAVTALALAGEGKLTLDVPISTYLPWLTPGLGSLTMTQLLSHTAGLGEGTPNIAPQLNGALAPVCSAMNDSAFVTRPGETWGYTNMGYSLAWCVIEVVTGLPFGRAVTETVFRPIGMTRSTFNPLVAMTYPHAQGHDTRGEAPIVVRPYNAVPANAPAGALVTTVDELRYWPARCLGTVRSTGPRSCHQAFSKGLPPSVGMVERYWVGCATTVSVSSSAIIGDCGSSSTKASLVDLARPSHLQRVEG